MTKGSTTLPGVDASVQLRVALIDVERRLAAEFPQLPHAVVAETVGSRAARWAGAPVTEFVPLLTERASRRHLRQRAAPSTPLSLRCPRSPDRASSVARRS